MFEKKTESTQQYKQVELKCPYCSTKFEFDTDLRLGRNKAFLQQILSVSGNDLERQDATYSQGDLGIKDIVKKITNALEKKGKPQFVLVWAQCEHCNKIFDSLLGNKREISGLDLTIPLR